jgi:COP9 signalosome complex subunit 1
MGNEDLGKHLESIGDLSAAADTYSKMRPDVSTPKQLLDVGKHLVRVAIQRREWGMVSAHLSKLGGAQHAEEERAFQPYLKVAQGIALLGQEKYRDAAISFLSADSIVSAATYSELASQSDVASYGGLLALASMNRKELQHHVLDNAGFRAFLEHAPHIRRAVTQFVSGRYSACIAVLEAYRADYLLDLYLQKHVAAVYSQIRSKCIVQYLIPFSCVSFETMDRAFGGPGQDIEGELADMIQAGVLQARINTIDKVNPSPPSEIGVNKLAKLTPLFFSLLLKLVTTQVANPRAQMQESALRTAEAYERLALDRLRRMGLAAAELELKSGKRQHPFGEMVDETLG